MYWGIHSGTTSMRTRQKKKLNCDLFARGLSSSLGEFQRRGGPSEMSQIEERRQGLWTPHLKQSLDGRCPQIRTMILGDVASEKGLSCESNTPNCRDECRGSLGVSQYQQSPHCDVFIIKEISKKFKSVAHMIRLPLFSYPFNSMWHILQYLICRKCYA